MLGNDIPAAFWMVIISAITLMFCLILYYFAMTIRQTSKTVENANRITDEIAHIASDIRFLTGGVKNFVMNPISIMKDKFKGFKGVGGKEE
jgi:predicted PurR-regulated permease PerM